MANSTTNIDTIQTNQASKEVTANAFFDAASQSATYGRRASTTSGLTWGFYGGNIINAAGNLAQVANGTLTLTASATNYVVAAKSNGSVSVSTATTNWNDATNYWRLYEVVAGSATVTSYIDHRAPGSYQGGGTGGGLTHWQESKSNSAPNATVPASLLVPQDAAANVDAVIQPKGSGAFLLQIPDNTSAGGNKRGDRAVDLQLQRSAASQVASGDGSFAWGIRNTSDASYSSAGGIEAHTKGNRSKAYSCGAFATPGDAQCRDFVLRYQTADGSAQQLVNNTSLTPNAQNQNVLRNNSLHAIRGTVVARQSSTGDSKAWFIEAAAKRGASADSTALLGTPVVTVLGADPGAAAWTVAVVSDTTNGAIAVQVVGEAGKSIKWVAHLTSTEVEG